MYIMNGILELKAEVSCADSAFQSFTFRTFLFAKLSKGLVKGNFLKSFVDIGNSQSVSRQNLT